MALTEALRLLITADTAGAVQGIDKVGKASQAADKHVKSSQASLDKWGRGLTTAGAGMIGFGAVALVGLGHMAKASEEANLSQVKLRNTIANMPKLAGENSKQFTDLAQKLQSVTAADGDAIVAGEAMLGTFNLTAKQIKGITPLVVDYSRKFGVDMVSAATQVGKALDGNVGALKRNGVSIDEAMFKTDRYGAVQKALSDQVGGFARAEGATFAGSLERMKNQLGDLEEGVGRGAVEAFTTLFGAVGKVAGAFEKISPGAQSAIGKIATFGAVGLTAAGGLSVLIGQAMLARERFAAAASAVSGLTSKLGGLAGVGAFTGATVGIGLLTVELERLGDEADKRTIDKITGQLNRMSGAFDSDLADRIHKWAEAGREVGGVDVVFKNFSKVLDESVPAARRFVDVVDHLDSSTKQLIGAKTIERMREAVDEKAKSDVGAAAAQRTYTDEVQRGADAMEGQTGATQDASAALQEYIDKLTAQFDPLFGATDALLDNAKAQEEVRAKTLLLAAAERDHGKGSAQAAEAQRELTAAQLGVGKSALATDQAMARLRAGVKDGTVSIADANATIRRWRSQGLIPAGSTADAIARQFAGASREADALGRRHAKPRVEVVGTNTARARIKQVRDEIFALPGYKQVHVAVVATGMAQISIMEAKLLRFGSGGTVPGPIGKERVIIAHGGEEIIPRHDKAAMARYRPQAFGRPATASGGGGVMIENHFHMEGAIVSSKADAQRWVADAWNKAAANRMVNVRGRPL